MNVDTRESSSGHAYRRETEIAGHRFRQTSVVARSSRRAFRLCSVRVPLGILYTYQISLRKFDIVVELCSKCLKVRVFIGKSLKPIINRILICAVYFFRSCVFVSLSDSSTVVVIVVRICCFLFILLVYISIVGIDFGKSKTLQFLFVLTFCILSLMTSSTQLLYLTDKTYLIAKCSL